MELRCKHLHRCGRKKKLNFFLFFLPSYSINFHFSTYLVSLPMIKIWNKTAFQRVIPSYWQWFTALSLSHKNLQIHFLHLLFLHISGVFVVAMSPLQKAYGIRRHRKLSSDFIQWSEYFCWRQWFTQLTSSSCMFTFEKLLKKDV